MALIRKSGKTKVMYFKGDTAREVRDGGAVVLTDSGTVVPPRNDSTDRIIGVAMRNDTVAQDTTTLVPVEVPVELAVEWEADVDSDAGAADSDILQAVAFDTTGGGSVLAGDSAGMRVDISDGTQEQFLITRRVSTTKVIGVIIDNAFSQDFDT